MSEDGQQENLGKMGNNRNICMQIWGWSVWKENTGFYHWHQNFCCALIQFLNARQDFRGKNERNLNFQPTVTAFHP